MYLLKIDTDLLHNSHTKDMDLQFCMVRHLEIGRFQLKTNMVST